MRFIILIMLLVQALGAQQAISVTNAASHGFGSTPADSVAPGSLISVQLNFQSGPIAPIDPSTVSIQIQPGGSVQVLGVPGPSEVLGLLSDDVPLGPATLSITFNGRTSAPAKITIVPASFGLFTRSRGIGPVLAQNSLTHPAKPGDFVTLWGTGLAKALGRQLTVTIFLGGHPVAASYSGPAPGLPGTDQINFQMPDDPAIPNGCYVAVAVEAGGYTSNTGMLSTSADGSPCRSPFEFTAAQLAQLDAGSSVNLGQVNLYNMVGSPPSPNPFFIVNGFTRLESADAMFMTLNAASVAQLVQPLRAEDAAYGCAQVRGAVGAFLSTFQILSAGDKVTLSKDGSSLDLLPETPQFSPFYRAQLPQAPPVDSPDAVPPPFFAPGVWQVSAPGSKDVGPFTGQLIVPPPLRIAHASDLATIDHTQDLTIIWNGADYSNDYTATIQLFSSNAGLVCSAPASAGQLTIPSALMQSTPQAWLELLLSPRPDRLTTVTASLGNGGTMPVILRYYPSEVLLVQIQ